MTTKSSCSTMCCCSVLSFRFRNRLPHPQVSPEVLPGNTMTFRLLPPIGFQWLSRWSRDRAPEPLIKTTMIMPSASR